MKYVKLFEEYPSNDAAVLVIRMFDPTKDTLAFNFVEIIKKGKNWVSDRDK